MAADITSTATVVARLPGGAHCQPMTSWDHTIVPNIRNTATALPRVIRLAVTWSAGPSSWPPRPARLSRASRPALATSAVRRQERGCSARSAISSSVNSAP